MVVMIINHDTTLKCLKRINKKNRFMDQFKYLGSGVVLRTSWIFKQISMRLMIFIGLLSL